MAGFNYKCQDGNSQYNESTEFCCSAQGDPGTLGNQYHTDQVHQVCDTAVRSVGIRNVRLGGGVQLV